MSDPVRRDRLLAPGATKREIAIHDADAAIEDIDTRVPQRVGGPDIAAVPVEFLAYRAWGRSVDVYDPLWPEGVRRAVIVAAPLVHATKGSLDSVEKALAALQIDTVITEWWQTTPRGVPGTFQIRALARARLYEGPILDDWLIA